MLTPTNREALSTSAPPELPGLRAASVWITFSTSVPADPERVALVNVLARFKSDQPVDLLRAVVKGDDELSAEAAALGLARRWDDAALVPLIRMLKSGHSTRAAVRHQRGPRGFSR